MFGYIVRRILATIPVMVVVAIFVFALLHLSPGDPAAIIAGDNATAADIARIRSKLGLDQPLFVQFYDWVWHLVRGDLGISIFTNLPVSQLIAQRVGPTVALSISTLLVSVLVSIPMGVLAAWKAGTWIDRVVMVFAVMGFSVPIFVLAYILIFGLAMGGWYVAADWLVAHVTQGIGLTRLYQSWQDLGLQQVAQKFALPVQGYVPPQDGIRPFLSHLVMPSIALGMVFTALIARITRASMLEVLAQDYIRTAHAKGLSNEKVLLRHALKNAAVPIATIIGIGVALLIGGVVVTETVFAIPGLGRLTVDAILRRDYPIIQGIILIFSAAYVVVNLLVDLSYAFLDPRIRY
jgi:peptide/nickel transport system permease protein